MPTSYLFASDQLLEPMNRQVLGHLQDIGTRQAASTERMGEAILQGYTAIADVRMKQEAFAQRAQAMQMENQLAAQNMQLRAQELDLRRQEHEFGKQTQQSDELERALLNIAGKKRMIQKNGQWMHQTVLNGKIHLTEATEDEISGHKREEEARMSELESRTDENRAKAKYYRGRAETGAPAIDDIIKYAGMLLREGVVFDAEAAYETASKILSGKKDQPQIAPPPPGAESRPSTASQPSQAAPGQPAPAVTKQPPPGNKIQGTKAGFDAARAFEEGEKDYESLAMDIVTKQLTKEVVDGKVKYAPSDKLLELVGFSPFGRRASENRPAFEKKAKDEAMSVYVNLMQEAENEFLRQAFADPTLDIDQARTLMRRSMSSKEFRNVYQSFVLGFLRTKGFNVPTQVQATRQRTQGK